MTDPSAPRRARRHTSGVRGLVAAAATVVVTVGALAVAGAAPRSAGPGPAPEPRAEISERTFVCTGGIEGAVAIHGAAGRDVVRRPLDEVLRIHVGRQRARDAFAVQLAEDDRPLAMGRCPEPANEWWFVAAGAAVRHGTTLVVDNPRPGEAIVDIEVFGPEGEVDAPGLRGIIIGGNSTRALDLPEVAAANGNLAVHVTTSRGLVSVAAVDRFVVGGLGATVREWLPDQSRARRELRLVGLPADPSRADLFVANPGQVDVVVELELVGEDGPFVPKGKESLTVPPGSVSRLDVTDAFDGSPVSLRLRAQRPVVATVRSVQGSDVAFATAATPLQGVSTFGAPAAEDRELLVTALGRDATYRLVTFDASGRRLDRRTVQVDAQTTRRLDLPRRARSGRLVGSRPDAVAALLVRDDGIAAVSIPPAVRALKLPVVRPGW